VIRTAESVLLTCWPPEPEARKVSMRMSLSWISISTSSTSGRTATVAAEVWIRPLRLRRRDALDAVDAAFELQPAEDAVAGDGGDDFLVAPGVALGRRVQLDPPAARRGVARIHAEQVAGEDGGLVSAGAGADFQHGRGVLVGVARGQQQGDVALHVRQAGVQGVQLVGGHGGHFGILGHHRQVHDLGPHLCQRRDGVGDRLHLGVFLRQAHDLLTVGGRAHARLHLMEAVEHLIEPGLGQSQGRGRLF
jgi:hypothetical protein